MSGQASQRFGLAGLARATQRSLSWANFGQGDKKAAPAKHEASNEAIDRLIEAEIIPRLMLNNRAAAEDLSPDAAANSSTRFEPGDIDAFARKAVIKDPEELVAEVYRLAGSGLDYDDILLRLLAPVARRLGKLWEEDIYDFTEVTIGLMKLHRVLERLNADKPCGLGAGDGAPRIYLSPAPGEQHVFGLVMVGEFFARSGWRVRCELNAERDQLIREVSGSFFDIIGLSASSETSLELLASVIGEVRASSRNRDVVIMVGGQVFNEDAGLAGRVGADATASDGVRAVVTAERMVHSLTRAERAAQS